MEYNNYYPAQPGHPQQISQQQQHSAPQMQQTPPGGPVMHAPMPPQAIRQAMPPGPPAHQQQQQQPPQLQQMPQSQQHQQHPGHHPQQMAPQQSQQQQPPQHANYHQIHPSHPHGPPGPHSGSPHHPQHHHVHQPPMSGPLPEQSALPSQQHMHHHSPHHHGGPPMHMQQPQQPLNQIVRPAMGHSIMSHPQPGLQPAHHQQNFFTSGPQANVHHYPHQNHHHHHHPHQHPHHQPPIMIHGSPMTPHHPQTQPPIGRSSPYYSSILQTEFRIIELNRRLRCRPLSRHPVSPLPDGYDESIWWEKFTSEFFEDDATLTLRLQDDKPVEYTIGRTLIPRFFRTYFDGGVTDLSFSLRNPKEAYIHPQLITLDCDQAFIITNNIFKHPSLPPSQGVVVHTEGHLILDFVSSYDTLSIKSWKFYFKGCKEYIDRSLLTAMGVHNGLSVDSITRQGLTKSTFNYLKMCMIIEPMQDLMSRHKQTKVDPRSCLRKFLHDKFNWTRTGVNEDNRVTPNKRRKRKPSNAPNITGAATKRTKASVNNSIGNNSGLNNNAMLSPSATPNFSLASQDVMIVGEPSMMGGDFGDDNERKITRLENTQYNPTASTPSNTEGSDSLTTSAENDNCLTNVNDTETNIENHAPSPQDKQQQLIPQSNQTPTHTFPPRQIHIKTEPNIPQQPQPQPQQPQPQPQQQPVDPIPTEIDGIQKKVSESSPQETDSKSVQALPQEAQVKDEDPDQCPISQEFNSVDVPKEQIVLHGDIESQINDHPTSVTTDQRSEDSEDQKNQAQNQQPTIQAQPMKLQPPSISQPKEIASEEVEQLETANAKVDHIETANDSSLMLDSVEQTENHNSSVQPMNDESDSNSQLLCSTASTTTAIEQQPVDNGVA